MRVSVHIHLTVFVLLCGMAVCRAESVRPLQPVKLHVEGGSIDLPAPALYDGREVYVPLEAARALKCKVVMPEKEDYAVVASPKGHRREIALARPRKAPMIPLSLLAPILDMRFTVTGDVCELLPTAVPTTPKAALTRQQPSSSVPPPVQPQPSSTAAGTAAARDQSAPALRQAQRPPSAAGVQTPERLEGDTQPQSGPATAAVAAPADEGPAIVPPPTKVGDVRLPSVLRDIVCEAVDPAQTRLVLVAEGTLRPTVRMSNNMAEMAVDLPGTVPGSPQQVWVFDNPLVRGARVTAASSATGVTRVVFELGRLVTYRDRALPPDGHEIVVRLPKLVGRRFEEMRVVIDPGHGGPSATGCSAMVNGRRIYEKDINLAIAQQVRARLERAGLNVLMTRTGDTAVSLSERPALANRELADVFVSIHVDDAPGNSRASGPTAYYHGTDQEGRALGLSIVQCVAAAGGLISRGARSDMSRFRTGMAVLKRAEMPAVLVEVAYISNPSDRAKLISGDFQGEVAGAIAEGIRRYVEGRLPALAPKSAVPEVVPQTPERL
jgi:N-acetylmuramoyl-L-alanine amidase